MLYYTLLIMLAAIQKIPGCFLDENQKSYSNGNKSNTQEERKQKNHQTGDFFF